MRQLLDAKLRPIPSCLVGDANAERIRPELQRSWVDLQRAIRDRGDQLKSAAAGVDLLGELADMTEGINAKAADVDRLVMVKSNDSIDPAIKKLLVRRNKL